MHATAAVTDAARDPEPDRPTGARAWLQTYGLRALVAALGVVAAAGVILTDDQDPIVFAIPVLVATTVIVSALTFARSDARAYQRVAKEHGLTYDGVRPVPGITTILGAGHAPVPMISGDLDVYGPDVRIAFLKTQLVAIVDLSEEPAGARTELGAPNEAWLADQPLRARAELEDETLVVGVDRATPPRQLLELTRALVGRL